MNHTIGSPTRCLTVWLLTTAATLLLLAVTRPAVRDAGALLGPSADAIRFDTLLVGTCAVVGAGCLLWLWLVASLVVLGALRGRIEPMTGVPDRLRRVVLSACGLVLVAGPVAPALATPGTLHVEEGRSETSTSIAGLPLPDRAEGGPGSRQATHAAERSAVPRIVVRPGYSLWSIAERLAPTASDAQTGALTHRLHRLNRDVIGADPDLIRPGQRLLAPEPHLPDHESPQSPR